MFSIYDAPRLVAAIRQGDESAFQILVTQTRSALLDYCTSIIRPVSLAEDIVQDVYTTQWIHRARWQLRGSLLAYLRRAVYNRAMDVITAERKQQWVSHHAPVPRPVNNTDHRVITSEIEAITLDVIAGLPLRYRQVFLLRGVCRQHRNDVARTLSLTPSTINYYLVAARREIFEQLAARGVDLPRWVTRPEMIFRHTTTRPKRRGNSSRAPSVEITMQVDMTQYEPTSPFAGVTVEIAD